MARTTTQGQSYPLLDRVADSATREVLRMLMDQVNQLRQPASSTDFGGNDIAGLPSTPATENSAACKSYVDTAVAEVRGNLLAAGATPLDVTALRGQLSQVQRAKLRVIPDGDPLPSVGQPFELAYAISTAELLYYNASINEWVVI